MYLYICKWPLADMPINILSLSFIKCNEVVECFMDGVSTVLSHRCGGLGVLKILLFFSSKHGRVREGNREVSAHEHPRKGLGMWLCTQDG